MVVGAVGPGLTFPLLHSLLCFTGYDPQDSEVREGWIGRLPWWVGVGGGLGWGGGGGEVMRGGVSGL